jgi:hypothetical protein
MPTHNWFESSTMRSCSFHRWTQGIQVSQRAGIQELGSVGSVGSRALVPGSLPGCIVGILGAVGQSDLMGSGGGRASRPPSTVQLL